MRQRRLLHDSSEEVTINLTPLIDVVFVILIIFILIAPLLQIDRIDLAQGSEKKESNMNQNTLAIYVRKDDSIWFHGKKITQKQLLTALQEEKRKSHERSVRLFQDQEAHFGTYQSVKNIVESAGFEELDVILKPS